MLCRFVPDGVAKAEKVRDRSWFFHPKYHHHLEAAPCNPDPEVNLVKESSGPTRLYVLCRYRLTYPHPPRSPPYPSGTFPLFPFLGSTDDFGNADRRDVFVSALSVQAWTEGWSSNVIETLDGICSIFVEPRACPSSRPRHLWVSYTSHVLLLFSPCPAPCLSAFLPVLFSCLCPSGLAVKPSSCRCQYYSEFSLKVLALRTICGFTDGSTRPQH